MEFDFSRVVLKTSLRSPLRMRRNKSTLEIMSKSKYCHFSLSLTSYGWRTSLSRRKGGKPSKAEYLLKVQPVYYFKTKSKFHVKTDGA